MVQSKSLVVAALTTATLLYSANPAFGATIPIRRDDELALVARDSSKNAPSKEKFHGHDIEYWRHAAKDGKSQVSMANKHFQSVMKLLKYMVKHAKGQIDTTHLTKVLKLIAEDLKLSKSKGGKSDQNADKDGTKEKDDKDKKEKSFKKNGDKKSDDGSNGNKARDVEDELVARDLEDDDLFARELQGEDLFTREFDDDELVAREFDDDELVARELYGELESRDLLEPFDEVEARDFDEELYERSDAFDDLD